MAEPNPNAVDRTPNGGSAPPPLAEKAPPAAPAASATPAPTQGQASNTQTQEDLTHRPQQVYRVVPRGDGSHDVYMSLGGLEPDQKLGSATIGADNAKDLLNKTPGLNPGTGAYENVPKETALAIMGGRPAPQEWIERNFHAGEADIAVVGPAQDFFSGKISEEKMLEQAEPELIQQQLAQAPQTIYSGSTGKAVIDAIQHPVQAAKDAAYLTAGGVARMAPFAGDVLVHGAEGAALVGGATMLALAAGGLTAESAGGLSGFAVAAAPLVRQGIMLGNEVGTYKRVADVASAQMAISLAQKGIHPDTIKAVAPIAGAIQGLLMNQMFNLLPASLRRVFLAKVLPSDAVKGVLNKWVQHYVAGTVKGAGIMATAGTLNSLVTNMAALADKRPELLVSGKDMLKNFITTAVSTLPVMATMQAPGAMLEGALSDRRQPEPGPSAEPGNGSSSGAALAGENPRGTSGGGLGKSSGQPSGESVAPEATYVNVSKEVKADLQLPTLEILSPEAQKEAADRLWAAADAELKKEQEAEKSAGAPKEEPASDNRFVKNEPAEIRLGKNDKQTWDNVRQDLTGRIKAQIARGNQLVQQIKNLVPDAVERQGMFWNKAAGGDRAILEAALTDPKLKEFSGQIKAALNLSEPAKQALSLVNRYYEEAGQVSEQVGTIQDTVENYQNRLYQVDKQSDFANFGPGNFRRLQTTTRHAMERQFSTEFDAARAMSDGTFQAKFATTDVADSLAIHNEEMAKVNEQRKTFNALTSSGVEGLQKGLKAVTEPNVHAEGVLGAVARWQSAVKRGEFSGSLVHHFNLAAQLVYQFSPSELAKGVVADKFLADPAFQEREQAWVRKGLESPVTGISQDIARELGPESLLDKAAELPGIKQVADTAGKVKDWLFTKALRLWKTDTADQLLARWEQQNPDALPGSSGHSQAMRDIAVHVNDMFGGQNWEAKGVTKSELALMRLTTLAPDYTESNLHMIRSTVLGDALLRRLSASHLVRGIAVGMAANEIANLISTGHLTDKNPRGHGTEFQVAPHVFGSFVRGPVGDALKLFSMVRESGGVGVVRFGESKLGPAARTAIGLMANQDYAGRQIWSQKKDSAMMKTGKALKFVTLNNAPIPFGVQNLIEYQMHEEQPSRLAEIMIALGAARYSVPPKHEAGKVERGF